MSIQSIQRAAHEFANALPMTGPDDRAGMKDSIKRSGVLDPVVYFNGKLLDGRTRMSIVEELNAEGCKRVTTRVNPETNETETVESPYECPRVDFTGTEQEALEYVASKGIHRRHLSSSQKAVVGVRMYLLGKKVIKKAKKAGQELTSHNAELATIAGSPDDGDVAAWVAKVTGTNRTYVFKAKKLLEATGGNALADKVMSGELAINAALAALAEAEAESPEGGAPDDAPVVLDGLRRAVAEEFAPFFQTREQFKEVDQKLRALTTDIEKLCDGVGGAYLHQTELLALVKNIKAGLKDGQPHAVCPKCRGKGQNPDNPRTGCPLCKRSKYTSKAVYDAFMREHGATPPETPEEAEAAQAQAEDPAPVEVAD